MEMCSSRLSAHCQKCFWAREEDEEEDRLRHTATTCEVAESEFFWGEKEVVCSLYTAPCLEERGGRQTAVNDLNQRSLTAAGVDPTLFFALFVSLPRPLCHLNRMIK